ncbi:PREDICTED: uncharacterized protein LOC105364228 [Ceratosolen solmsi marchali]|uniref:Mitochondria-eating protein n=1 Tax=Ceratosolen solmsi marchali TaxID=326594 RepID=A0AAJ6YLR4_9HYME|nr:PREDICTED: uncharacterized protein LOC105364228 [Ceratosolen solmsi marchali]
MSRKAMPLMELNTCERIRPERPRNTIQKLVWMPSSQFHLDFVGICEDEGLNPRTALRRLLRLYEGCHYHEAAGFLMRLPNYTLRATFSDIPIDLLIETLPHSLVLLEALYVRLIELGVRDTKVLRLEQLLWKIVGLMSTVQNSFNLKAWARLLTILHRAAPSIRAVLIYRWRALEQAIEGLGKHGLILSKPKSSASDTSTNNGNATSNLVPLRVALREELEMRSEACKHALHKIENLEKHAGVHKGDQGMHAASHQRQLSLKYYEVQQRLIDNQGLLNILEKTRGEHLDLLLKELKSRVEQDKEALRQWTALHKIIAAQEISITNAKNPPPLATRLLEFSRGCAVALQLMNGDGTVDLNNPFNINNYDDDEEEEASSSSAGYHTDESCSPSPESGSNCITDEALQGLPCSDVEAEQLRERYALLYSQGNLHTLDALNNLEPLKNAFELKLKILYSVVILSWRHAGILQASRRVEALKILNGSNAQSQLSAPADLEDSIRHQLATVGAQSGIREVGHQVVTQLDRILYDFPCLKNSSEMKKYALSCSRLAWTCLSRATPLVLDDNRSIEFRREIHVRHHSSPKPTGNRIKAVLWPALREGLQGPFLHKAVVLTY